MTIKKGEPEGLTVPLLVKMDNEWITLPASCLEEMGWKVGDTIDIVETSDCFDWGTVPALLLRNISKEKREL